jgi:hypothetical protein
MRVITPSPQPEDKRIASLLSYLRILYTHLLLDISSLYEAILDTLPGDRARIARRLSALAEQFIKEPSKIEPLMKIDHAAKSHHRFKRCYALDTLGRLGSQPQEFISTQVAQTTIPTQVDGLLSDDQFIREAASQALFRLGKLAAPAKDALVAVLLKHVTEGTARYAVLALREIKDKSPEVLNALKHVAFASDSYATEEAEEAYLKLTGEHLQRSQREL